MFYELATVLALLISFAACLSNVIDDVAQTSNMLSLVGKPSLK